MNLVRAVQARTGPSLLSTAVHARSAHAPPCAVSFPRLASRNISRDGRGTLHKKTSLVPSLPPNFSSFFLFPRLLDLPYLRLCVPSLRHPSRPSPPPKGRRGQAGTLSDAAQSSIIQPAPHTAHYSAVQPRTALPGTA